MRRFACLAFAAGCLSSPALAQPTPGGTQLPSPADISKRDTVTVGVGAAVIPDYEGSNDYRVIPAGAIRGQVSGISFTTRGAYLYVDVVSRSGGSRSPSARLPTWSWFWAQTTRRSGRARVSSRARPSIDPKLA